MKIPALAGMIDRRILINYQVDGEVLKKILPPPFKPKLITGKGVAGICLIRLKNVRPAIMPFNLGLSSENAAHRIAVEWKENGELKEGVFIPRRDTSSTMNALAGGRLFPGVHHRAEFKVTEEYGRYAVAFNSDDGTFLSIEANETVHWNTGSVFEDQACASDFFRRGAVGYSPGREAETFDGIELAANTWEVKPLDVTSVQSSFFANEQMFPKGSLQFDNALLMRNIDHQWKSMPSIQSINQL